MSISSAKTTFSKTISHYHNNTFFDLINLLQLSITHKKSLNLTRQCHAQLISQNLTQNPFAPTKLITSYFTCKCPDTAKLVFESIHLPNVILWNSLIHGYVENSKFFHALQQFDKMCKRCVLPDDLTLSMISKVCGELGDLRIGNLVHGKCVRSGVVLDTIVANAIMSMYYKCGVFTESLKVFDEMTLRSSASWDVLCSGSVGLNESVIDKYQFEPSLEACACVVDLLGRTGRLDEALEFIKTMPVEPGLIVWGALVNSSITHGNTKMQDLAYRFLIDLEPGNPSNYVSLSNVCASTKKWGGVAEVRRIMRERGLKKVPGCSWINLGTKTHSFVVADKSHPCSGLIYEILKDLTSIMKGDGDCYTDSMDMV